ncbi:MAG: tripartite tricarboxylate transporter substrate binding protein [Betaproteobacteria bacterium]
MDTIEFRPAARVRPEQSNAVFGRARIASIVAAVLTLTFGALTLGLSIAQAQEYPSKPVRFVVPYPPGGSGDLLGRLFAEHLAKALNAPVFVENKPGAATNIALELVSRASPDGYTLMLGTGQTAINEVFGPKPTIDIQSGVTSIGLIAEMPFIILAGPETGIKTAQDMVAKSKMGQVTIGHAQFEPQINLLSAATGAKLDSIPYAGGAASIMSAIGGQVALVGSYVPVATAQVKAGKLRGIGVASPKRINALPDVPTFAEQGFPKFTTSLSYSVLTPKGTPEAILKKLAAAVEAVATDPIYVERLRAQGSEPLSGSSDAAAALLREDLKKWEEVKKAN